MIMLKPILSQGIHRNQEIKFWEIMYYMQTKEIWISVACLTEKKIQETSSTGIFCSWNHKITFIQDNILSEAKTHRME